MSDRQRCVNCTWWDYRGRAEIKPTTTAACLCQKRAQFAGREITFADDHLRRRWRNLPALAAQGE
jgi:hypothetical protein